MATPTKFTAEILSDDENYLATVVVEMEERENAPVYIHVHGLPGSGVKCWLLPADVARALAQGIVGVVR